METDTRNWQPWGLANGSGVLGGELGRLPAWQRPIRCYRGSASFPPVPKACVLLTCSFLGRGSLHRLGWGQEQRR